TTGGPYVSARCREVAANPSAVDAVVPTLGHCLGESGRHALPDTGLAPPQKAPIDRIPWAALLRHISPWGAGSQPPKNAIDDIAFVLRRAACACRGLLVWQHPFQNPPFGLRQIAPTQGCTPESAALNQFGIRASTNLSTQPRAIGA